MPAARWGTGEYLQQWFGHAASDIRITSRDFVFRYRSPTHWIDVFRSWYGPGHKAFASVSRDAQQELETDILDLRREFNRSGNETLAAPGEYVEVVITKR